MSDLYATIRLRPTRIALLVRPSDLPSIRKFMRICACLWGGAYNPIIPVFRSRPRDWRPDVPDSLTGVQIARGYVEFFEPDVFVEAEPGLLERIGLGELRGASALRPPVISLDALLACRDDRDWSELEFGLGIADVLNDIYERERRFQLRDARPAYLVKRRPGTGLVEAVFGLYPTDEPSGYFARDYAAVFKPDVVEATPDIWTKVYMKGGLSPLRLTEYRLERQPPSSPNPNFFVFDPAMATDLIDLWNLRIEPRAVLPLPIDWWPDLAGEISSHITAVHRPLQGGPRGAMHRTIVEFARSIAEARQRDCVDKLDSSLPRGSCNSKHWRTPVWEQHRGEGMEPFRPLRVLAEERSLTLTVSDGDSPTTEFANLAPHFASLYGGHRARWINVVSLVSFRPDEIATVLPPNVTNSEWPRMGSSLARVIVSTEGWSFPQRFKDSAQTVRLHTQEGAVVASLEHRGVKAVLSDAGQIAKQVLQHLRGLNGVGLLAYPDTLKLLNDMAVGLRIRNQGDVEVEEIFDPRTRTEKHWRDHLAERRGRRPLSPFHLADFTDRNVLRLGITTRCPSCTVANWHSLSTVDYVVSCERCLEKYPFPQGALDSTNRDWRYRVIGPFSTPGFARGSYGALLALKTLRGVGHGSERMTCSPALELRFGDDDTCEVDYAAWVRNPPAHHEAHPSLVFGEAKSFGEGDLIRTRDLAQLRRVGNRFPGAVIVVSVMKEKFTASELRNLLPFVKWGRRLNANWMTTNPVVLLTGVELFHEIDIPSTWRTKGDRHKRFADYQWTHSLYRLAEATQAIYLDLPRFVEDQRAEEERRRRRLNR